MNKVLSKIMFATIFCIIIINLINPVISQGKISTNVEISNKYKSTFVEPANSILGALKVIGIIFAVAMAMIIGIKYMLSNPEEKAENKIKFQYYIIGAILVGSAPQVIDFIYKLVNTI